MLENFRVNVLNKQDNAERLAEDSVPFLVFLLHLTDKVADPHGTILNNLLICQFPCEKLNY